ncbi:MAG: energy transducer TonB, partial [Rhodoferax sp.]|nr:energy transducer TonB [Rhodoferax sp.]
DGPPIYRDDCLPDPPAFRNPFVWNGQGEPPRVTRVPTASTDADQAAAGLSMEECLKLLPQDSVEAEAAHDRRLRDQWDSSALKR